MPTFYDVPQELWNRIVQLFKYDPETLLNLCLTSMHFVDEAQSHLYTIIRIVPDERPLLPCINISKALNLFSTFTNNPSLAKYVKTFVYKHELQEDGPGCDDLRQVLQLMVNVTWLEIITDISLQHDLFQDCAFQLEHFRCSFASSDSTSIYKFLSTQSSLRSLYIDTVTEDFPLDCCINLERLFVEYWQNVLQVLPGRSISTLELLQVEHFFDSVPPSIAAELGNLTHLTFKSHMPHDFLQSVVPYLTRLIVLRIIGRDDPTPSGESIAGDPYVLAQLTNLEIFVWTLEYHRSYLNRFDVTMVLNDQVEHLVNTWFQLLPRLKVVYSRDYDYEYDPDHYACWERDGGARWVNSEEALGGKSFYTM